MNWLFIYSIYTRKYGFLNSRIVDEKISPIFTYNREYEVDIDSYIETFPNVAGYYTFKLVFTIIFVIVIVVCAALALLCFMKLRRKLSVDDINIGGDDSNIKLVDESREATVNK